MEKQVLFETQVDIVKPPQPKALSSNQEPQHHQLAIISSDSAELELSQASFARGSCSAGHSLHGLVRSTNLGGTNYNYGYSSERQTGPELCSFHKLNDTWIQARNRQLRGTVAGWTCIALLSLIILATLATVLTWCIIIPRRPGFQLVDGATRVESLNISADVNSNPQDAGDGTAALLSTNFTFEILVKNPNRVAMDYSSTSFTVNYKDTVVGKPSLPAFSQKPHARTQQAVNVLIKKAHVLQQNGDSMLVDSRVNNSITLQVEGYVHARFRVLRLSTPRLRIRLSCSIQMQVLEPKVSSQQCQTIRSFWR